ncbi:MAG: hypothetical protein RIS09_473 [Actinomycetota bacterium]|jgi:uncharacterized membrane protein
MSQNAFGIFQDVLRVCYSDISALYGARDFDSGIIPYFQMQSDGQYLEYPVLIGMQMFGTGAFTWFVSPGSWQIFTSINWIINLIFVLIAVSYLHQLNEQAARLFAFSPALLLVLGINWDALAIMFMVMGIYYFLQHRYLAMGVVLGLGMSAKLFPILILPIALVYLWQERNFKAIVQSILSAIASWLIVNIVFIVFAFDGWIRFFEFSRERGIDFGSPYLALRHLLNIEISTSHANNLGLLSVVIAYLVVFLLRKKISFIVAVALVLGVFVIMNKVYSPQFWLWLSPIFALLIRNLWLWIGWNVAQTLYYFAVWAFIASFTNQSYSLGPTGYAWFIVLNIFATVFVLWVTLRSAIRNQPQPEHDQIRL